MERPNSFWLIFALSFILRAADGGYLITTPRRWTLGEKTQVCVSLTDGQTFGPDDSLDAEIVLLSYSRNQKEVFPPISISKQIFHFSSGESNECADLNVPEKIYSTVTSNIEEPSLNLKGTLAGNLISESVNVSVESVTPSTFIQTDKYLYKPGHTVQFRILSAGGPFLNVLTEPYSLIYVENPSGTRIQQWRNVENKNGLIHMSFELSDEVDEGTYKITVERKEGAGSRSTKYFKIEDYVLPRYEITITPQAVILGSDKTVDIEVCAKYTYGEDLKGKATLSLAGASWSRTFTNETQSKPISGCVSFTFETNKLRFDDNNCHIRISKLKARAVIVEEGTNVELVKEHNNIGVSREVLKFTNVSPSQMKKPFMPRFVKIRATFNDGKVAAHKRMNVCTDFHHERICKQLTTSDEGYLNFITRAAASRDSSNIEVTSVDYTTINRNWNDVMKVSKLKEYYSYRTKSYIDPSKSSLTIYDKSTIKCTTGNPVAATIPVIFFVRKEISAEVFVQVLSRGQIQHIQKKRVDFAPSDLPYKNFDVLIEPEQIPSDFTQGSFDITLDLSEQVSPSLKLLVWFTTSEGIVVADTAEINVENCLSHKVNMKWSAPKAEPGTNLDLTITGAKNSLCSVGIVDKSVELLSNKQSNYLSVYDILNIVYAHDVGRWDKDQLSLTYCLLKYNGDLDKANRHLSSLSEEENLVYRRDNAANRYGRYRTDSKYEALHMFIDAGYHVLTDQTIQRQYCYNTITNAIKDEERRKEQERNRPPGGSFGHNDRRTSYSGVSSFSSRPQYSHDGSSLKQHSSRPTMLEHSVIEIEQQTERTYLPETWLWNLVTLSDAGESKESIKIPDTITEWAGRTVCVHPSEGVGISNPSSVVTFTHFFTDLTLPATIKRGEIMPLKVSVFNYMDEDLPVKLVLVPSISHEPAVGVQNVRHICVPAKDKSVETIRMEFLDLGDVNITVEASVDHNSPLSCGSGTVNFARLDRLTRSMPVEAEGIMKEKTWSRYICGEDYTDQTTSVAAWRISAPSDIVKGSERLWLTASGDLMGPTIENIGRIVDYPSGCGEQNMVNFAPNVYIKQYLDATNQLTDNLKHKLNHYLRRGYQRQLRFLHRDGSFSSFGSRDATGSTWLTAFVLNSFNEARPHTFIDPNVLRSASAYLQKKQNNVTGCFESEGRVIHKMLQGGLDKAGKGNILLSAYVLAALGSLTDNGLFPPVDLEKNNNFLPHPDSISLAIACIENDENTHPYSLALRAYSLAIVNATGASDVIKTLLDAAVVTSSEISWDMPETGSNTALRVETAGYALLALITYDEKAHIEKSRKIVRWLTGHRNSRGGFISTQDTVVALKALSAFQSTLPAVKRDMIVEIHTPNIYIDRYIYTFNILESNKLVEQKSIVSNVPDEFTLFVRGTGCGIIQAVMRYNVLADSPSDAFVLNVIATNSDINCRQHHLSACASYTLSDKASNMAIIEFKLQTGFVVDKAHLVEVMNADKSGNLKRFEVDGSKVIFYFEQITSNKTCVGFQVYQNIAIENIKEGYVKVYDYYQPEFATSQDYKLTTASDCNTIH